MSNDEKLNINTNTNTFEEVLDNKGFLIYKNVGISMLPLIKEGRDIIKIKKRPEGRLKKYDVVLFRRNNIVGRGRYVLHRVLNVNSDGTYWIVGDNCTSGERVREENILGVLTTIIRNGKQINVTDKKYVAYVRLWCAPYKLRFFVLRYKVYPEALIRKIKKLFVKNSSK